MIDTPFFFNNGHYRLFGVLHTPPHPPPMSHPNPPLEGLGLVFCDPIIEEKLCSRRVMVNLARHLAARGAWCLRFDYMGQGDSQGNFEDSTVETMLSDIQTAVTVLRSSAGAKTRIGLLGLRFGATLATLASSRMSFIDTLILLAPIVKGKAYIEACLRSNLAAQITLHGRVLKDRKALARDLMDDKTVNIDGHLLTKSLYLQMLEVDLIIGPHVLPPHVLIMNITHPRAKTAYRDIQDLELALLHRAADVRSLDVEEHPFWTDTKTYVPRARRLENTLTNALIQNRFWKAKGV